MGLDFTKLAVFAKSCVESEDLLDVMDVQDDFLKHLFVFTAPVFQILKIC